MKTSVLVKIKETYLPDAADAAGPVGGEMPDLTGASAEPDLTGASESNPPESDPYDLRWTYVYTEDI